MIIKRFFLSFLISLSIVINPILASEFVCTTDSVYIDYKAGNRLDLDSATKYAGKDICENNCRDYTSCQEDTDSTYFCPIRKYENLGGDAHNGTNFTDASTCSSKCYSQNNCVQLVENPCKPVDIEYTNPVTDYTGKTIYTERRVVYECTNTQTKLAGCNNWEIKTNNGSFDYNTSGVGTVYKSRTETKEAQNLMAMLEQQLHIFSGWEGYCEDGTMFNNPFSDPMAILGYAMMVYSAVDAGSFGEGAKETLGEAQNTVTETYDTVADHLEYSLDPDGAARMDFKTWKATQQGYTGAASTSGSLIDTDFSLFNDYENMNKITTLVSKESVSIFSQDLNLLWTDVIQAAMLLTPTEEEIQQADYFNKAWMGDSDADENALAYANCMASIGLSMPNLVSSYTGDINNTSSELNNFWENPIRFTPQQLSILVSATSEKYARVAYIEYDYDPDRRMLTLIAKDKSAYYQAGQVICGGKLAISENILQQEAVDNGDDGGSSGIGMGVAKMALTKLATVIGGPIAGIVVSLVIDIITSLESGDACHDTDIASQWGLIQLKTNRFLNFDQCHKTRSSCAAKWFWGSCMRDKHEYCCYDQISTRIFAEGLKEQMYPPIDSATGLANTHIWESCNDITINDLKDISFRKCLPEEEPYDDHCFPADKYDEFEDAIRNNGVVDFDFQGAADQAINSLAIPNKVCEIK
jgi:hypothetical protein